MRVTFHQACERSAPSCTLSEKIPLFQTSLNSREIVKEILRVRVWLFGNIPFPNVMKMIKKE